MDNEEKFVCAVCGETFTPDELTEVHNGDLVCPDCLSSHYTKCDDCGEYYPDDEVTRVYNDDYVCDRCLDFKTFSVKEGAQIKVFPSNAIEAGWDGLDAGPESREKFAAAIEGAKTILWNGPAGCFECEDFTPGSRAIGDAIAKATAEGAFSLIGGGDSVACVNKFGLADKVSYISTGGGALLEAIEGKVLPGIAAIKGE